MRLGILQCDSVNPDLRNEYGDYPDMVRALMTEVDPGIEFRVYDLPSGEFPQSTDECDAWITTGSKWSVYDPDDWIADAHELVRALHTDRRLMIGICFGHQLIARALGGSVEKSDRGWGVGVHTTRILEQRDWMQPTARHLSLLVSHQDQVMTLPENAVLLAGHDFCPYDMFQIGEHILTFQGHPEFRPDYARALLNLRREQVGETTWREAIASLDSRIDRTVAATWIRQFLAQAARSDLGSFTTVRDKG